MSMDRRTTIKWMLAAAATAPSLQVSLGAEAATLARDVAAGQKGYGTDPQLTKEWKPGGPWPLTLGAAARLTTAALCDLIVPADDRSPAASAVGVVDFIDEWISAPYPGHDADKTTVIEGLAWIDKEAQKRFQNDFVNLIARQKNAICDDICYAPTAKAEFQQAARFFGRYRDLTAGGYYSTPEGMKDIGYTGNVPMEKFVVPAEALKKLGLA